VVFFKVLKMSDILRDDTDGYAEIVYRSLRKEFQVNNSLKVKTVPVYYLLNLPRITVKNEFHE
jgi:hypothetical protein